MTRLSGRKGLEVWTLAIQSTCSPRDISSAEQFTILCSAFILCQQVNGNVIGKVATHFISSELHEYECYSISKARLASLIRERESPEASSEEP